MPDLPPAERLTTPGTPTSRAEEARLATRLVRRRFADPGERTEILAALGLPDSEKELDDGDRPTTTGMTTDGRHAPALRP